MSRHRIIIRRVSAALAVVALAAACGDGATGPSNRPPVTVPNRAPEAAGTIPGLTLTGGDTESVDVSSYFSDPDGDALSYAATSSDEEVSTVSASGSTVTVTGVAAGTATVTVTATDPEGLSAQQSFEVTVEWPRPQASLSVSAAASPEGGVAILEVVLTPPELVLPPRESPITVSYTLGVDADPGTADADALDYADVAMGVLEIGTESNEAVIEIPIHDDDNIEPVREVFTVTLDEPAAGTGYELGSVTSAVLTIEEGVCDRTQQVRDEIMRLAEVSTCTDTEDRPLGVCAAEAQLTEPNGHGAVRGEADPGDWEVEDLCLRRIGRAEWMRWGGKRATRALAPADAGVNPRAVMPPEGCAAASH